VPSFLHASDEEVDAPDHGTVRYDMAYGGNFYAILPAEQLGLTLDPARAPELIGRGLEVMAAVNAQRRPVHPEQRRSAAAGTSSSPGHRPGGRVGAQRRRHPPRVGRPLPVRHRHLGADGAAPRARGAGPRQPYVHESLIGSRFTGRLVEETTVGGLPAVVPTIRGRAWITGLGQYLLDPTDPYPRASCSAPSPRPSA
jgi:proline racemase